MDRWLVLLCVLSSVVMVMVVVVVVVVVAMVAVVAVKVENALARLSSRLTSPRARHRAWSWSHWRDQVLGPSVARRLAMLMVVMVRVVEIVVEVGNALVCVTAPHARCLAWPRSHWRCQQRKPTVVGRAGDLLHHLEERCCCPLESRRRLEKHRHGARIRQAEQG